MENETMKQSFMSVQNRSSRHRLAASRFKQVFAAGALLAAAAAATQPAVAAPEKVVVYQAFQSIMYLPLYVAMDKGFFAQNGLDVQKVTAGSGAQGVAAVIGGVANSWAVFLIALVVLVIAQLVTGDIRPNRRR